ncbi:hypothetical protein FO519_009995 [Halicephalobus sp. NKZ332]|nr:hypothetical protein FO519_009995 [Halicephalobus sp. NKZ332]
MYNGNYEQSTVTIFQAMLNTLKSGFYNNYAFLVIAHTDTEYQLAAVYGLVQQIIQYDVPIYVVDASVKFFDRQQLFLNLTKQRPERIFNASDYTAANLTAKLQATIIQEFNNLGCEPMTVSGNAERPPSFSASSGICPSPDAGTTWEYKPLGTSPSTTTRAPDSGITCGGVIFLAEMTSYISFQHHVEFFELIKKLKSKFSSGLDFGFAQFGTVVYRNVEIVDSSTFDSQVAEAFDQYLSAGTPSGNQNNLIDILNQLAVTLISNTGEHYAVLLMSELDALQNPSKANAAASNIAGLGIDVYVLDYSSGLVPDSIWSTITRGKPGHVLKAGNKTLDELTNYFSDNFVYDVNNRNC